MDVPRFIELKPREEILEVVHATLLVHVWKFVVLILWTVLPFFFLFPLWRQGVWGVAVFFLWLGSGLIILSRLYVIWARTVFLITDSRVVDHDQKGFFHRVVTQARYDQMDEVSYHVKGIAPTLFRYGTLRLQLRGSSADIEVSHVRRPDHLADVINDLRTETSAKVAILQRSGTQAPLQRPF